MEAVADEQHLGSNREVGVAYLDGGAKGTPFSILRHVRARQVSESCEAISQDRFNKQHMDCTNSRAYIPYQPNRDKKECLCRTSALPWRMNLGKEE